MLAWKARGTHAQNTFPSIYQNATLMKHEAYNNQ